MAGLLITNGNERSWNLPVAGANGNAADAHEVQPPPGQHTVHQQISPEARPKEESKDTYFA